MLPSWLQELKDAEVRATPGKWLCARAKGNKVRDFICTVAPGMQHRVYTEHTSGTRPSADMDFIVVARNEFPRLIRIAEAAQDVCDHSCDVQDHEDKCQECCYDGTRCDEDCRLAFEQGNRVVTLRKLLRGEEGKNL